MLVSIKVPLKSHDGTGDVVQDAGSVLGLRGAVPAALPPSSAAGTHGAGVTAPRRATHSADGAHPTPASPAGPFVRTRPRTITPRRRTLDPKRRLFLESFRTLRANVLALSQQGLQSVLVTSARPQEGKSTIAAGLAGIIAASDRHVLLVDADLRRPSAHLIFGVTNDLGLSDVLTGAATVDEACIHMTDALAVLTSGPAPEDAQQLLLRPSLHETLAGVRGGFDFVIIDSPPVLSVADATVLAREVDGIVVVMRSGLVTAEDARHLSARLSGAGTRIVGSVLNHFAGPLDSYYHPYASGYVRE